MAQKDGLGLHVFQCFVEPRRITLLFIILTFLFALFLFSCKQSKTSYSAVSSSTFITQSSPLPSYICQNQQVLTMACSWLFFSWRWSIVIWIYSSPIKSNFLTVQIGIVSVQMSFSYYLLSVVRPSVFL